jgi:hypothetical protein
MMRFESGDHDNYAVHNQRMLSQLQQNALRVREVTRKPALAETLPIAPTMQYVVFSSFSRHDVI